MTFEEIKSKYPIGFILKSVPVNVHDTKIYYNQKDLEIYRKQYTIVDVMPMNICECYRTDILETKVEGWVFDGEDWAVAYNTWDGWQTYDDDELMEFEISRIKKDYWDKHPLEF